MHKAGGRIVLQIWHSGRVAHPDMRRGEMPVGPSAIPATGDFFLPTGRVDFPTPRVLRIEELPGIVETFAQATRNARLAGFDGVELHGGNGYLIDQFLQDGSNQRTDDYGGPIEHRARLLLETAEAMVGGWSAKHVGVRLSPSSTLYGMHDTDKRATFGYAVKALDALGLVYLHLTESNANVLKAGGVQIEHVAETFRPMITRPLIINTGFDKAKGDAVGASRAGRRRLRKGICSFRDFGIEPSSRMRRMEEAIEILRLTSSRENVEYTGQYWRFRNLTVLPRPV